MPSIPKTTKALILQNAAKDEPEYTLGKANSTFALKELELAELSEGQLLVCIDHITTVFFSGADFGAAGPHHLPFERSCSAR